MTDDDRHPHDPSYRLEGEPHGWPGLSGPVPFAGMAGAAAGAGRPRGPMPASGKGAPARAGAAGPPPAPPAEAVAAATLDLRIMATSDLHMQLLAYDYRRGGRAGAAPASLEGLVPVIAAARAGGVNALLFDNGDLVQGNPLADHVAASWRDGDGRAQAHPAVACLNALGCDAATLGNHDFSYGARFLDRVIQGAAYPVVLTNARLPGLAGLRHATVLQRVFADRAGVRHPLRVGVIGFVPPQTAAWEAAAVPSLRTGDVLAAARDEVPRLRAAGADLVVALVHGGVVDAPHRDGDENAAAAVAALPGIDAVVAGHVHEVLPRAGLTADYPRPGPAPVVMPGFAGSHLGVIDLVLERGRGGEGWVVRRSSARCLPAVPPADGGSAATSDPAGGGRREGRGRALRPEPVSPVRRAVLEAHAAAIRAARVRVGRSAGPIDSHFTLLGQDAGLRLIAMAQRWQVRRAIAGGPFEGLPVVIAGAQFRAGGRGGPGYYIDLPAGPLRKGDLADLYPFTNRSAAIVVTGATLTDWLERGAGAFRRIAPGLADQPLLDEGFPSYSFDLLDGLTWRVDLSRPARYDAGGGRRHDGPGRIDALRHRGLPVAPDQRFILAANDFRLSGVGLYGPLTAAAAVVPIDCRPLRQVLADYLRLRRVVPAAVAVPSFTFAPVPGASAVFQTAPAALPRLDRAPLPVEALGIADDGFLRLRLRLDG